LAATAQLSGVSIRFNLDGQDSLLVCFPEGELKQVLYNLVINAIQASRAGQTVTVSAQHRGNTIWLDVVDEGEGISPAVLPDIFDPFFSTKSEQGRSGMGLGLSVSRNLVESMNGCIEVSSEVGKGSRFRVVLPYNND
jgi:signal transduction histidine kinase